VVHMFQLPCLNHGHKVYSAVHPTEYRRCFRLLVVRFRLVNCDGRVRFPSMLSLSVRLDRIVTGRIATISMAYDLASRICIACFANFHVGRCRDCAAARAYVRILLYVAFFQSLAFSVFLIARRISFHVADY
jgi:hypothetical protein